MHTAASTPTAIIAQVIALGVTRVGMTARVR